ncbi:MAG: hypothetical protein KatS3mg085_604 [Candidatus Dojkabacteria bacterium]|nr:MAG: hypothetical protein KatS3mg085_604 [Candidatus Dojkabacteria bacterium]
MKFNLRYLLIIVIIFNFSFLLFQVNAQPSELNEIPEAIPEEIPTNDVPLEQTNTVAQDIDEIKRQQFIDGAIVGGGFGIIAGGVIVWFLKDTFF